MNDVIERGSKYDLVDRYPGGARASELLEGVILSQGVKSAADIGGGANPLLSAEFAGRVLSDYCLMDISGSELEKAKGYSRKLQVDMTDPNFPNLVPADSFDLVFSHMFLEHVDDPWQVHRNLHHCLRSGGLSIHFYPSPNNLPLTVNRVVPEWMSRVLVRVAQPDRELSGNQGKFKAYYRLCGNPSKKLTTIYGTLGFAVVEHVAYIGHFYYDRFPLARFLERKLRPLLLQARVPLSSFIFLMLKKI